MDEKSRQEWIQELQRQEESGKSWVIAICLSVFLGMFGADRFYLGYILSGILKLITFGGAGIWWIIDIVRLFRGKFPDAGGNGLTMPSKFKHG